MALAVSLLVAASIVIGLAVLTWRTAREHRSASESVLRDYASFGAWSFASRVRYATFLAINPVFEGAQRALTDRTSIVDGMSKAEDSIQRCRCGIDLDPQLFFAIDLAAQVQALRLRDSTISTDAMNERVAAIKSAAHDAFARHAASRGDGAIPYMWIAHGGAEPWIAFYAARFRSPDDPGRIAGFVVRSRKFSDAVLSPSFSNAPLLPASVTKSAVPSSLMLLTVATRDSTPFFKSTGTFDTQYSASEPLGEPDTALIVTVSINPDAAGRMIIGGLPASPVLTVLPLVSLAIVLLAVTFLIARKRETQSLQLRANLSEARLAALRAQLHPHFLFNVLNSIVMLARKGDNKAVVGTLTRLSDLLRVLLRDSPREVVELNEELQLVRKYLELEQVRFQDRLRIDIPDPGELGDVLVPGMILQPLAENAIRHGLSAHNGDGLISVTAMRSGEHVVLEVRDNGPGVGQATSSTGNGIGLSNARERLAQLYGDGASLLLSEAENGGTVARIIIPLERKESA